MRPYLAALSITTLLWAWPSPSIGGESRAIDFTVQYCKEAGKGGSDCGPALNLRPRTLRTGTAPDWSSSLADRTRRSFTESSRPGDFYCVQPDMCAGTHGKSLSIMVRKRF